MRFRQYSLVVALLVLMVGLVFSPVCEAKGKTVSGKIESITFQPLAPMKGVLVIKKFWGSSVAVHVGIKTRYVPKRIPQVGDKVTVEYIVVKGKPAATKVLFNK